MSAFFIYSWKYTPQYIAFRYMIRSRRSNNIVINDEPGNVEITQHVSIFNVILLEGKWCTGSIGVMTSIRFAYLSKVWITRLREGYGKLCWKLSFRSCRNWINHQMWRIVKGKNPVFCFATKHGLSSRCFAAACLPDRFFSSLKAILTNVDEWWYLCM